MSDEEARRTALRLAALASLKTSAASKRAGPSKEKLGAPHGEVSAPAPQDEGLTLEETAALYLQEEEPRESVPEPERHGVAPVLPAELAAESLPEQATAEPPLTHSDWAHERPPARKEPGRAHEASRETKRVHKTGYRDVDMPDDAADMLAYIDYDEEPKPVIDARSARPRISYADEFSAQPIAPSGELEVARWLDLPLDSAAHTPPVHLHPKQFPARRAPASDVPRQDPQAVAHSLTRNTFARFVNRPLRGPMIIEWSDDEEEEETPVVPTRPSPYPYDATPERRATGQVPSAVLSEKEREIKKMMARIQQLEEKRRSLQGQSPKGGTTSSRLPSSVLGKRAASDDMQSVSSLLNDENADTKVRCARAFGKDKDSCRTASKNRGVFDHVQDPHGIYQCTSNLTTTVMWSCRN